MHGHSQKDGLGASWFLCMLTLHGGYQAPCLNDVACPAGLNELTDKEESPEWKLLNIHGVGFADGLPWLVFIPIAAPSKMVASGL